MAPFFPPSQKRKATGFPVLGNLLDFWATKPWEQLASYHSTHGPVAHITLLGKSLYVLNDPASIEQALISEAAKFTKGIPVHALSPILGTHNAFVCNGARWLEERTKSPFHGEDLSLWMKEEAPSFYQGVYRWVQETAQGVQPFDLTNSLMGLVFDLWAKRFCGRTLGKKQLERFIQLSEFGTRRLSIWDIPVPPLDPRFWMVRTSWAKHNQRMVHETLSTTNEDNRSFLYRWLSRTSFGEPISKQTERFVDTLFFGGGVSTPAALANTLHFLNENREILEQLRGEVSPLIEDGSADFSKSPLLEKCLLESLRILPPVPLFFRTVLPNQSVTLGGYDMPGGSLCTISNYHIHRSEEYWDAPLVFDPERWTELLRKTRPLGSRLFFPFGQGERACQGSAIAMFTLRATLASIVHYCDFVTDGYSNQKKDYFLIGVVLPKLRCHLNPTSFQKRTRIQQKRPPRAATS